MRVALDTNILVYAEGVRRTTDDQFKHVVALRLIENMVEHQMSLSVQAMAELHSVLVRRGRLSPAEAGGRVGLWASRAELIDTRANLFQDALDLAAAHNLQVFDAIILAAAAHADCELLVSEDLHDGFAWRGVTVTNPFRQAPDPRLAALLQAR